MTDRPPPRGPRVSARVAADLTGIDPDDLDKLILSGTIRTERIGGKRFIVLDDAERAAKDARKEGDRQ